MDEIDLSVLTDDDLALLEWRQTWLNGAHAHQLPPSDDLWHIWLVLAGRGSGKTRGAAEWVGWEGVMEPDSRTLVSAPTAADLRDTCFEGESGLINVIPPRFIKDYNRSLNEIILRCPAGGTALIKGIPASEPDRFRGGQWHRVWADELAAWQYLQDAFDMIMFALRLGKRPRFLGTTTPKPKPLIRNLARRDGKDVRLVRASTYSNLENLAPTFKAQILQYEGTQLGRQEIEGEIIDPAEAGIVRRSWIRMWPASKPLPQFQYILMSLDTAYGEETYDKKKQEPDFSACSVWGVFQEKKDRNAALLLDCWQERLSLPLLVDRVKAALQNTYGEVDRPIIRPLIGPSYATELHVGKKVDHVLIEEKASGKSLRQYLATEGIPTFGYNPGNADKLMRLNLVALWPKQGYIYVPESDTRPGQFRTWAEPLLTQLCEFSGEGSTDYDDLLDTTTQAWRLLADHRWFRAPGKIVVGEDLPPKRAPLSEGRGPIYG